MQKYATRGDDSIGKNVPCGAAPSQERAAQTRASVAKCNAPPISTPARLADAKAPAPPGRAATRSVAEVNRKPRLRRGAQQRGALRRSIESPGSAGGAQQRGALRRSIESPGSAGARSNAKRCGGESTSRQAFVGIAPAVRVQHQGMARKRPAVSPEEQAMFLAALDGVTPLDGRDRIAVPPPPPSPVRVVELPPEVKLTVEGDGRAYTARAPGVSRAQLAELRGGKVRAEETL